MHEVILTHFILLCVLLKLPVLLSLMSLLHSITIVPVCRKPVGKTLLAVSDLQSKHVGRQIYLLSMHVDGLLAASVG